MKDLIRKYRTNSLSHDEIKETRRRLASITDDELARHLGDDWDSYKCDPAGVAQATERAVWGRILGRSLSRRRPWAVVARVAAVALIVVLTVSTLWLYNDNRGMSSMEIATSTGYGERASVRLPDGSTVVLNSLSTVSYRVDAFSGNERRVGFDGEGYFDITRRDDAPFIIDTRELQVLVKGTSFNLSARTTATTSTLFLVEGCVALTARAGGETVTLHPDEKAVLDHATGHISVSATGPNDNLLAWKERRLTFTNATLAEVVERLESGYMIEIEYDNELHTERFTGAIPLDDLHNAVDIVETSFHTKLCLERNCIIN